MDSSCDSDLDSDDAEAENEGPAQRIERLFMENDVLVASDAPHFVASNDSISSNGRTGKQAPLLDINYTMVVDKLREMSCNWFAFVVSLQHQFKIEGHSAEVLDKFLLDFASQLSELELTDEEHRLTEQSRVAYLETLRQREADNDRLPMPVDSSDEEENSNLGGDAADQGQA